MQVSLVQRSCGPFGKLQSHDKFVTGRNWYSDGPIDSFRLLPFDSTALTVGAQTLVFTDNRDNEDIQ